MISPLEGLDAITIPLVKHIRHVIPETLAVYVYGSRVRGGLHPASDLDLALLLPKHNDASPLMLAQLQGDLESLAGISVEISILSLETQIVHCKEVVAGGRPVFAADPRLVDEFEMRALSSYARLCEDRAPVLEAYARRSNE
jgi:predicted nucleotidyltransferase